MFKLMHEMRVRIMSSPAFTGDKVIGAILFEGTMDGQAKGKPVPAFLWEDRGVVPFLKVDKGLETEKDGVSLMKPIPGLDSVLERAAKLGVYGTKMRSTIHLPRRTGEVVVPLAVTLRTLACVMKPPRGLSPGSCTRRMAIPFTPGMP